LLAGYMIAPANQLGSLRECGIELSIRAVAACSIAWTKKATEMEQST
jgi:hypothetical protein